MDNLLLKSYIKGLLTFIPGLRAVAPKQGSGGGTQSAEYCYGVWLKHLSFLSTHADFSMPKRVAELGPGSSLGVGYAALLSGALHYTALDVVAHAASTDRLGLFEQLLKLIQSNAPRPVKGWPDFDYLLNDDLSLQALLDHRTLSDPLQEEKVSKLRHELAKPGASANVDSRIDYVVPWDDPKSIKEGTLDLVFSQSVLEYVKDLHECYKIQWHWLRHGGYISHQVDLTSHAITDDWDGIRTLNNFQWKIVSGKRPFCLNRLACSAHLHAMEQAGFEIELVLKREAVPVAAIGTQWETQNSDDAKISGLFVQARKPLR